VLHHSQGTKRGDTRNCWGKALRPKSDILRFPPASKSRFSGCPLRTKKATISYQKMWGFPCLHVFVLLLLQSEEIMVLLANINTYLEVSVIHTPTVAVVHCIDELLEILPWLILPQSPIVQLKGPQELKKTQTQ
jgi:hypothetical protein